MSPRYMYHRCDGEVLPVTNLYAGNLETKDKRAATAVVARFPSGKFLVEECNHDELEYVH